jgi:predicted ferric reductase
MLEEKHWQAYGAVETSCGSIAFYLALLMGPTFYLKRWISRRWWHLLHRLSLVIYLLSVIHTFTYGSDLSLDHGLAYWLLVAVQIPVLDSCCWTACLRRFRYGKSAAHTVSRLCCTALERRKRQSLDTVS